jgi:hypothetical protein
VVRGGGEKMESGKMNAGKTGNLEE